MLSEFGNLYTVIGTGVVIIVLFIILSIFKTIFSSAFIGMSLSIYAYLVVEYYYNGIPVLSCVGLLLSLIGLCKSGLLKRIFAVIGIIFSVYKILITFGIV